MIDTTRPETGTAEDATRYLSDSIPVVSSHFRHAVTVSRARDEIRHAALRLSANMAGPSVRRLVARLERATGCTIAQLALQAQRWPATARPGPPHRDDEIAPATANGGGRQE